MAEKVFTAVKPFSVDVFNFETGDVVDGVALRYVEPFGETFVTATTAPVAIIKKDNADG